MAGRHPAIRLPDMTAPLARVVLGVVLATAAVANLDASAAWAAEEPSTVGRWSEPFWEGGEAAFDPPSLDKSRRFPTAATAIVLPDGRLLYWNGLEGSENGDLWVGSADGTIIVENSRVRLLDLRSGSPRWTTSALERGTTDEPQAGAATQDMFCSDQKLLHNGSVLVAGGSRWDVPDDTRFPEPRGVTATRIFDPASDSFRSVGEMREPRWYPSLVTLPDGRVMVASGVRRVIASFTDPNPALSQVKLTEIYDASTQSWEDAGISQWSFPLYPRLHLMPDGTVFYGGAGQSWNPFGETADQAAWGLQRSYDPQAKRWKSIGLARYGVRSGAASAMLRLEPPYDRADILVAGGTFGSAPGTWAASTLSEIIRWTPAGISNVGEFKPPLAGVTGDRSQLRNRRWFGTPVMLPTGEVFLTNGGDADDVLDPGSAAPVRTPELYDPESGTWSELAPARRDRVYHNSAVLLPDGRVLVGGNAPHPAHYTTHENPVTRSNNFRDSTFEIYEPPYLFRGRRPNVTNVVPGQDGRALRLTLGSDTSAGDISEVSLVRMGANTHSMDADMRSVELEHSGAGATVVASLPKQADARILPPGPYYVFAMRESDEGPVPSVAQVVMIRPAGDGKVLAAQP